MSFGLKNARATYQRLADKAFKNQIGRNLDAYVDDVLIKRHTKQEILREVEETFQTLRRINMKLNPKKCTFGAEEGMFLGHVVNIKGIKACPEKAEAVINLQSPRTLKEIIMLRRIRSKTHSYKPEGGRVHLRPEIRRLTLESIEERDILAVVEEEGYSWMTPLIEYLTKEPWFRCVDPLQAEYVVREIYKGSCSMHLGPRSVVAKDIRSVYYWPTMDKDAQNIIRKCDDFQVYRSIYFRQASIDQQTGQKSQPQLGRRHQSKVSEENKNWVEEVPHVLWVHRTKIKTSNGHTSFSLTYSTKVLIPIEIGMLSLRCAKIDQAINDEALLLNLDILEKEREKATIQKAKSKAKMERYYNAKVCSITFKQGDFVYRSNKTSHANVGRKLGLKREGPYKVVEALEKRAYKIRNSSGDILPRTWNVKDLKNGTFSFPT
nr:retrovirus-related Pol polyprotein from transposon 297 family [Tanacetum cinerariifolium]